MDSWDYKLAAPWFRTCLEAANFEDLSRVSSTGFERVCHQKTMCTFCSKSRSGLNCSWNHAQWEGFFITWILKVFCDPWLGSKNGCLSETLAQCIIVPKSFHCRVQIFLSQAHWSHRNIMEWALGSVRYFPRILYSHRKTLDIYKHVSLQRNERKWVYSGGSLKMHYQN